VKKGWTAERVLRTFGEPLNTTAATSGQMTWYYSNGRSVTLDARGRVLTTVGF
jgi:hypothetical protein